MPLRLLGDCTPGNLRLVNGSTEREGLVEVCMGENPNNTHWRTVCTNSSQQLAGAVCAQLGYLFEGEYFSMIINKKIIKLFNDQYVYLLQVFSKEVLWQHKTLFKVENFPSTD